MDCIEIVNWSKFQQYKDRRPNWIKLLIEIIEEFDADGNPKKFHKMPDAAKLTFILLACLRANYNKHIPFPSEKWLKKRLGVKRLSLQPIIDAGFIKINTGVAVQNGTKVYENAPPERETYKEEGEKEGEGYTKQNCIDEGFKQGISEQQAVAYFDHYNSVGWLDGAGRKITSLASSMAKWRANAHKFEKDEEWSIEKATEGIG